MAIDAQCPHCRKLLRAPGKKAGQQVNCPHCQQPILLPEKVATTPALPTVEVGGEVRAQVEQVDVGNRGLTDLALESKTESRMRIAAMPQGTLPDPPKSNGASASGATAVALWYLRTPDEQQYGPVQREELDHWVVEGRVDSECQILCEGWAQWKWANEVYPQLVDFPEVDRAQFFSRDERGRNGVMTAASIGTLPTTSGKPPPLPSHNAHAEAVAPNPVATVEGRAWIVTDIGLAIANAALWITSGGIVLSFGLYALGQTMSSASSLAMVGAMLAWMIYGLLTAQVVLVTGWCVCLRTPRQAAARVWIQAALVAVSGGFAVASLFSILALTVRFEAASTMVEHLPAVLLTTGLAAVGCFCLYLRKLGNFFGDARLSQQGTLCAGFQAVVVVWSQVALYGLESSTDTLAGVMRSVVTVVIIGGDAVWLGMLTRRARLPLKSL